MANLIARKPERGVEQRVQIDGSDSVRIGPGEAAKLLDDLPDALGTRSRRTQRLQHLGEPLVRDRGRLVRVLELLDHEVDVGRDERERVVDLVCHTRSQRAHRRQAIGQLDVCARVLQLAVVAHDEDDSDEQTVHVSVWRRVDGHGQRRAVPGREQRVTIFEQAVRELRVEVRHQVVLCRREDGRHMKAEEARGRLPEEPCHRGVRSADAPSRVEHEDAVQHRLDDRFQQHPLAVVIPDELADLGGHVVQEERECVDRVAPVRAFGPRVEVASRDRDELLDEPRDRLFVLAIAAVPLL